MLLKFVKIFFHANHVTHSGTQRGQTFNVQITLSESTQANYSSIRQSFEVWLDQLSKFLVSKIIIHE